MKILVLGSGPAGLLAAHAASFVEGAEVKILSRGKPSELFGCQYLHGPIPGLDLATTTVQYTLEGTAEDYALKVYGTRKMAGQVSAVHLYGDHPAWDIRQAYRALWERYSHAIEELEILPETVQPMLDYMSADLVVSSIPAPVLCQQPGAHAFTAQTCWALGDAPERGQYVPVPCPPDTVRCSGSDDHGWYRVSKVFGYRTAEWPGLRPAPPLPGVVPFHKPLATTCTCWHVSEGEQGSDVLRVGRYGTWTKGVLSHEAFNTTVKVLQERINA